MLGRSLLRATGNHQPQVHVVVHVVAVNGCLKRLSYFVASLADVEGDRSCAREQAIHVALQEREVSVMKPYAFPDAVAYQEPSVEHRDLGFVTGEELPVDVDLNRGVSLVCDRGVCALNHGRQLTGATSALGQNRKHVVAVVLKLGWANTLDLGQLHQGVWAVFSDCAKNHVSEHNVCGHLGPAGCF